MTISFNGSNEEDKKISDPFNNYDPGMFDFLARAKTDIEGIEIVDFLEEQEKISSRVADEIRNKIETEGIRSLAPFRGSNFYFQKAEELLTEKRIKKRQSLRIPDPETE